MIANKIMSPFMCISYWLELYDTLCSWKGTEKLLECFGLHTVTPSLRLPTERWPGWVGLGGWLRSETVYLPEGSHPSQYTNRAQCRATALIETDALPLHQTATSDGWRYRQTSCSLDTCCIEWMNGHYLTFHAILTQSIFRDSQSIALV